MVCKTSNAKHGVAHQSNALNFLYSLYIFVAFSLGNAFVADSATAGLSAAGVFPISSSVFLNVSWISAICDFDM